MTAAKGGRERFHFRNAFTQSDVSVGLQKFFDTAHKHDIYIVARPGPYIKSETDQGAFPRRLSRQSRPVGLWCSRSQMTSIVDYLTRRETENSYAVKSLAGL